MQTITITPQMQEVIDVIKSFELKDKVKDLFRKLLAKSESYKKTVSEKNEIPGLSIYGIKVANCALLKEQFGELFDTIESDYPRLQINTTQGTEHKFPMVWIGFKGGFSPEQKSAIMDNI